MSLNPKWRGTVWENFDFAAAKARLAQAVEEIKAETVPFRFSPRTEHERDHAAQGVGYSTSGWGR